ncbi:hypothetical protein CUJ83_11610 [Methanocella sp. CWC-04]|uniref:Uncharacterized protein n=1 Tax=Methanooceanicella nereidis TaxID=2052831 RepID=A0AAP2RE22_9EURY|nr:hypothetical protein [Methanocella sp. CWC-04]MCD1295644.1 hypothetical protein [Methanocella sp. CWC-04]
MVLGVLLGAVFGAIFGYILGWIVELFPNFNAALLDGINLLTGLDVSGQTRALFTAIGFICGILFGILNEFRKKNY